MTRINCIPVSELHNKHLVAEYRELPRVFRLAAAHAARHQGPPVTPSVYTLGEGHVKFFYARLEYCEDRFHQLVWEMEARGYKPQFRQVPRLPIPVEYWGSWEPTPEAMLINRERIQQRQPK